MHKNAIKVYINFRPRLASFIYSFLQKFAESMGMPYLETSAKDNTNVEQAFMTMSAEIKNRVGDLNPKDDFNEKVRIQSSKPVKYSTCC